MVIRTTPLSIRTRTSPRAEAITKAKASTSGPIIRPSKLGHERLILTGCPVAAPTLSTTSDTCFFISMGSSDGSLLIRPNRRNVPISSRKFADCLSYTALTTRYVVISGHLSIRPASWTRAVISSPSSSTTVARYRRISCWRLAAWRHAMCHLPRIGSCRGSYALPKQNCEHRASAPLPSSRLTFNTCLIKSIPMASRFALQSDA